MLAFWYTRRGSQDIFSEEDGNMLTYPQGITSIDQVAVVVPSLDQAMEQYWTKFGIGPWSVYTFKPDWIRDVTIRGRR
jgi:hypothetical protein